MSAERITASLLGLMAIGALVLQVPINMENNGTNMPQALWSMFRFFTIWTNTLCGIVLLMITFGRSVWPGFRAMLVMAIIIVGIVYHVLLAATHQVAGMEVLTNIIFHTALPILYPLHWVMFAAKDGLTYKGVLVWLAYPVLYCLYALTRGLFDGVFPYFFLDLPTLGAAMTAAYIIGLAALFYVMGCLVVMIGRATGMRG